MKTPTTSVDDFEPLAEFDIPGFTPAEAETLRGLKIAAKSAKQTGPDPAEVLGYITRARRLVVEAFTARVLADD